MFFIFYNNFLLFFTKEYEQYIKHMWMLTSFAESVLSLRMEFNQNKKWNLVKFYLPEIFELRFSTIVLA